VRRVTDAQPDPVPDVPGTSRTSAAEEVDLDTVERDLAAVEVALERLDDGTYWTDEVTGEPIPEHVLAADPTARRT
jgi:RNA polymerase-binding transcription factor DksA